GCRIVPLVEEGLEGLEDQRFVLCFSRLVHEFSRAFESFIFISFRQSERTNLVLPVHEAEWAVRTNWRAPSSRPWTTTTDHRSAPRQVPPARPVQRRHRRPCSEPTGWRRGCGPMSEPGRAAAR